MLADAPVHSIRIGADEHARGRPVAAEMLEFRQRDANPATRQLEALLRDVDRRRAVASDGFMRAERSRERFAGTVALCVRVVVERVQIERLPMSLVQRHPGSILHICRKDWRRLVQQHL